MTEDFNQLAADLRTVADWQRYLATHLNQSDVYFGHGAADGWEESTLFLSEVTATDFSDLQQILSCRLTLQEKEQLFEWLVERVFEKTPAAYLVNKAWFCGLPFYVDERVLVPRSPISELIEDQFQPWITSEPTRILDLCTGSGCIAIACAHAFPDAQVDATDISSDALQVANMNIEQHGLWERVTALESDGYDSIKDNRYDLIVTNPPYVDQEDMNDLPAEYYHEPELGLAAGNDGLDLVRRILLDGADMLNDGGILVCEVGNSLVHVAQAWPEVPFTWLEFERGGEGVFLLTKEQLLAHKEDFANGR